MEHVLEMKSIKSSWPTVRLAEVCQRITKGTTPTTVGAKFTESGIGFVKVESITDRGIRQDRLAYINAATHDLLSRSKLQSGDILFSIAGTIGRVALVPDEILPANTNQALAIIRPSPDVIDPKFLFYRLRDLTVLDDARARVVQSVQANYSLSELGNLQIALPSLSEQHSITYVLSTLDDKIELSHRMNRTLEDIARALFTSWFVDFDPVRAKAEGRQPEGMDVEMAALFPDAFEETELGQVPAGWEIHSLDEIASYLNGLALQRFPVTGDESLPAIKIAQLRRGDSVGADRVGVDVPPEYIVEDGDVLFSWSGSLEVEIWCGGRGALNQHLFKVTSPRFPMWFYYLWTKYHLPDFRAIAASKATTMGHIQRHHLKDALALAPPPALLALMDVVMSPIIQRIIAGRIESRSLAETRDMLLPKLLSGELTIPEAAIDNLDRTTRPMLEPALTSQME